MRAGLQGAEKVSQMIQRSCDTVLTSTAVDAMNVVESVVPWLTRPRTGSLSGQRRNGTKGQMTCTSVISHVGGCSAVDCTRVPEPITREPAGDVCRHRTTK